MNRKLTPTHEALLMILRDQANGEAIGVNNPLTIDLIAAGLVEEVAPRVKFTDGGIVNVVFTVEVL